MVDTIYLDNAATTPIAPEVRSAMAPFLDAEFGNASSRHPLGIRAGDALETARRQVARAVGARPGGVVFTSGGTEANNLAVLGFARARRREGTHVLVGPTEHPSVREAAAALGEEGFEVETARLDDRGDLDLLDLERRLRPDTVLVAQMLVNNEFGSVYDARAVVGLVRRLSPAAAVHVDAVQAFGKLELYLDELGADSLAVSAHKVHGPKGSGALVLREGTAPPRPLVHGGGQEDGIRPGTENVAGCVGLGFAAKLAAERTEVAAKAMAEARGALAAHLADLPGTRVLEPGNAIVPSVLAVLLPGPPAEVWMHHLEARGVMTSVGSACQAKTKELSPALLALGLDEHSARQVLRFSLSRLTTNEEIEAAAATLHGIALELGAVHS